ncbi:MAG: divalent cation tolerance protein CutA, partial [Actinomycetota bacterium]
AACVQLTPVRSVFHWDDRVEQDDEILLVAKARRDRFEASVALIQDLHSYELPAITFHPTAPSEPTATWIDQSLGTAENDT